MNLDNPKLTAFALGELPPAERPEVETFLSENAEGASELRETREIARILQQGLKWEPAGSLAPHQRDAIFRAAEIAQRERAEAASFPMSEREAGVGVAHSAWWDRPGPWQAIAASAVIGLASYALFVNVGGPRKQMEMAGMNEIVVRVPIDVAQGAPSSGDPQLISPNGNASLAPVTTAGIDPGKMLNQAPPVKSSPLKVELNPAELAATGANGGSEERASAPEVTPKPRGARLVSKGPGADYRSGASIGKVEHRLAAAPVTDEGVSTYLQERLKEAERLTPGGTYEDFAKVFRPMPGTPGKFEMIRTPAIKVDAEFDSATAHGTPAPEARLKKVSKPYLD